MIVLVIMFMLVGMKLFIVTETQIVFELFTVFIIVICQHHLDLLDNIRHQLIVVITHFVAIFKGIRCPPGIETGSSKSHGCPDLTALITRFFLRAFFYATKLVGLLNKFINTFKEY